jgi:hypothetical protein
MILIIAVTRHQRVSENLTYLLPGILAFNHIALLALWQKAKKVMHGKVEK